MQKQILLFFESLAKTSMLALSSPKSHYGKDNVFMIQLPRPEKAQDALRNYSKCTNSKKLKISGAVTGI